MDRSRRGALQRRLHRELGLSVVITDGPAHRMVLNTLAGAFRVLHAQLDSRGGGDAGVRYRYHDRTESWFELVTLQPLPRRDLRPLAARLDALEPARDGAQWCADAPTEPIPELYFGEPGAQEYGQITRVLRPEPAADRAGRTRGRAVLRGAGRAGPRGLMRPRLPGSAAARAALALLVVLLLGCLFPGQGAFYRPSLHLDLWGSEGVIGLLAIGQCLVVLSGGIDLSVGSVLALGNMTFALLMLAWGWPFWLALPVAALCGALLGAVNGLLVARLRVQPFLATLATMVIARGLARLVPVLADQPAGTKLLPPGGAAPESWQVLAGRVWGVPLLGLLFAALALGLGLLLRHSVAGRWLYAVGGNEDAARLSGVPVTRVKLLAYTLCGGLAGLAGACHATRDVHGNPGAGEAFELEAIAAVAIGGTSLRGGSGGIGLAVLGVLIVGYIDKILSINGEERHWRLMIHGLIILLAVILQNRRR